MQLLSRLYFSYMRAPHHVVRLILEHESSTRLAMKMEAKKEEWEIIIFIFFLAGGHSTFFGLLNTFVHIIMYAYYMLAAMGPSMQRYLWWKKYLTALQMVTLLFFVKMPRKNMLSRLYNEK